MSLAVLLDRIDGDLRQRRIDGLERSLRTYDRGATSLDFADNDYLGLATRPELQEVAFEASSRFGVSASASPLVAGFGRSHESLLERLKKWHGVSHGLIWNSGYAANQGVLSVLPQKGDVVLADRLIHHSMISGILRSGARLIRYAHADMIALATWLERLGPVDGQVFVVTESIFSMDGDSVDLVAMRELKRRFSFFWMVDEAHALGWYGLRGSGLLETFGCIQDVDLVMGTLGKALGSSGAYTLFHDERIGRYLMNYSGEFIYSTYLPPSCAAVAERAIDLIDEDAAGRGLGQRISRAFRAELRSVGFVAPDGDSAIVPIELGAAELALRYAFRLREGGIEVGVIRPPTVPQGTSRLRISLKVVHTEAERRQLIDALIECRAKI